MLTPSYRSIDHNPRPWLKGVPKAPFTVASRALSEAGRILCAMVVLRADPWSPEYGMGFEPAFEESPLPRADPTVETEDWSAPITPPPAAPRPLWFVDGVRRVDLRLLADEGDLRVPGLFGSYAVGAVRCDGRASFEAAWVSRAVVLGGGVVPQRAEVPCGSERLEFDPAVEAGVDPNRPLERLQGLMREAENALAARVVLDGAPLVVADGPLRLGEVGALPVVGVIKRFVRRYLGPEQESLLGRLGPGQRTPVFALQDQQAAVRGFSWYARLVELRPPWHDHTGLVRCEVRAAVGLDAALQLADHLSAVLPDYAGRPADPRTPQNLAPVAGLESWLRHRMGDRAMIRRALVAWLATEGERADG
jgi:hypothetical protein